jgi:hypothetical protein
MTLEYERLSEEIEQMALSTYRRRQVRQQLVESAFEKLRARATDWELIEVSLARAKDRVDRKKYRAARPLDRIESLDAAVDPPQLPAQATIVAVDGSQILPDRHATFLYSLINIGVLVYFHGHGTGHQPQQFTRPVLDYPDKDGVDGQQFSDNGAVVSLRRDQAEIEVLARTVWDHRQQAQPLLALLDQRLLYWPALGSGDLAGGRVLKAWQEAMTGIRESGGLLAGYIVRPGKQSVMILLETLDINESGFDLKRLTGRDLSLGLTDTDLFSLLLAPGQRSKVFVDVSHHNDDFQERDPLNEVCFFYLNPGRTGQQIAHGQVARIDIPISVAQDAGAVAAVHALVYDQCQILGGYPYVLARADEVAVVGRRDQDNLDAIIESAMGRQGITGQITAKQLSKFLARAGKTRHEI